MEYKFLANLSPEMAELVTEAIEAAHEVVESFESGAVCSNCSPDKAQDAAALLGAFGEIENALESGNCAALLDAALFAGMAVPNVWTAAHDAKGRSLGDIHSALMSGGRPASLNTEDIAKAKVLFDKLTDAGATNNSAVMQVMRELNRHRETPVVKSTVERAVGIRR